jgi:hypothetical protein
MPPALGAVADTKILNIESKSYLRFDRAFQAGSETQLMPAG